MGGYRERVFAGLDAGEFPRLSEVGCRWEELTARDTFAKGVRVGTGSPAAFVKSLAARALP